MKSITFRPLRRIKKTGKITVASYMQWRKVMTADYNKFNLVVYDEYKTMALDEYVYDHRGELLYFFTYNPADIPVFHAATFDIQGLNEIQDNYEMYGIQWRQGGHVSYIMKGADCGGVPTFAHWTADYIATNWKEVSHFEPLTVETVVKWFGWFLYQLNNSYLQIGK